MFFSTGQIKVVWNRWGFLTVNLLSSSNLDSKVEMETNSQEQEEDPFVISKEHLDKASDKVLPVLVRGMPMKPKVQGKSNSNMYDMSIYAYKYEGK